MTSIKMTVPKYQQGEVTTSCAAEDGAEPKRIPVPALTHPWCPGLAITMLDFGVFKVTHVATGHSMGGSYERSESAALELVQWALIGRAAGVSWEGNRGEVIRAITAAAELPVPFTGATSTQGGVTTPMTIGMWIQSTRSSLLGDEFPWEEESPGDVAWKLLSQLAPSTDKAGL